MSSKTLIIGGGPAGLSAAAALARAGRNAVIVDRNPTLGGQTTNWCCLATDTCQRCGLCLLHDVQQCVLQSDAIEQVTANVIAVEGSRDSFRATLATTGEQQDVLEAIEADSVVVASGFSPFDPKDGRPLGYGTLDPVVTTVDVNLALRDDDLSQLGFAGGDTKHIAFLQCVGSRDPESGRGYCSQTCCQGSLRAARALLHRHPDWKITVFYMDLQLYGKTTRSRFAALAPKLRLLQGVPAEVLPNDDGTVRMAFQGGDGNMCQESFDGVVLAVGMVPSPESGPLAESLGVGRTIGGFLDAAQTPDGVYVAGACAGPSFIEASLLSGRQAVSALLADSATACTRRAAVVGRGIEGNTAALALSAMGVDVTLVQLDPHASPLQDDTIEQVTAQEVTALQGQLGEFTLQLSGADESKVEADALVLAPGVVLSAEPDAALASAPHQSLADFELSLEKDWTQTRVALQLDPLGPAWRPAAARALKAATRAVAEKDAEVTVLFEHVALPGLHGQQRYDDARKAGVRFLRQSAPPQVADSDQPTLLLTDAAAPEIPVQLEVDSLVITDCQTSDDTLATLAERCGVGLDREGLVQRGGIRNFPMHTERPGIWVLGNARQEAGEKTVAAEAASVAAEVHALLTDDDRFTREGPAQIDKARCVHCLTCVRVCPHGAVIPHPALPPRMSATACEQCGACVAACPGQAITLTPAPLSKPPLDAPETVIFACRNSGVPALQTAGLPADAAVVELACGAAVDPLDMLDAFQGGAQRVLLLSCHAESCAHVDNHRHCAARAELLEATARRIGLPEGAFEHWTVAPAEGARVAHRLAAGSPKGGTP